MLCIYGQLCYIFTVIYSCSIVAFYMYDFYTIILYGIMLNLCQSWLLKLDIACHCSLFGSFGKYRNRTESTDTEFPRYRVSTGTDRYQLTEEPNLSRTEPKVPKPKYSVPCSVPSSGEPNLPRYIRFCISVNRSTELVPNYASSSSCYVFVMYLWTTLLHIYSNLLM